MGKLTLRAQKMLILLTKNVVKKMYYHNNDDRLDCLQTAYMCVFANWHNFDEMKGENAFAYYSEIIKRGLAQGWNRIYKHKGDDKVQFISLDGYDDDGNSYARF
jgi:hypothetical protein